MLKRDSKASLNVSWPVLPAGGMTEVTVADPGIEACILPRPIERVEEVHSEDRLHPFRKHGNLFGEVQVFTVAGEFANRERSRCIAKGKVRRRNECRWVQSAALASLPAAAPCADD